MIGTFEGWTARSQIVVMRRFRADLDELEALVDFNRRQGLIGPDEGFDFIEPLRNLMYEITGAVASGEHAVKFRPILQMVSNKIDSTKAAVEEGQRLFRERYTSGR